MKHKATKRRGAPPIILHKRGVSDGQSADGQPSGRSTNGSTCWSMCWAG